MAFDFFKWREAVFAMAKGMIEANDLLQASGLTDIDYLEQDLADLLREIEDDLDENADPIKTTQSNTPR